MPIRILAVDDHASFLQAVQSLLAHESDMAVVAEAKDGETAVRLADEWTPDVVLMDVALPGISGIEATRRITAAAPKCTVLGLSIRTERRLVEQVLAAGAVGYVSKETAGRDLVSAIRTVAAGDTFVSPELSGSPT